MFLSYDEPNAEENWERLLLVAPHATRVHGVKGILEAHQVCARLARTERFFVVDADCEVALDFDFDFEPDDDGDALYCWRSLNPVNGLLAGFGSIKLLSKRILERPRVEVDVATSLTHDYRPLPKLGGVTRFNTTAYTAWRGAFRECAKLVTRSRKKGEERERRRRIHVWTNVGADRPFGEWVIRGAREGLAYGSRNRDDLSALRLVNDYDWLAERFAAMHGATRPPPEIEWNGE